MPVSSDSYTVLGGGESVLLTRRRMEETRRSWWRWTRERVPSCGSLT